MTRVLERFAEIVHSISAGGGWIAMVAMWLLTALMAAEIISNPFSDIIYYHPGSITVAIVSSGNDGDSLDA